MTAREETPPLLALPAELIQQVLAFLPPLSLASVSATCTLLHNHALSDQLWQPLVNANLPHPVTHPGPLPSFRQLYIAHHPYWFLPRRRIWFSDAEPSGKLLVARYDPFRGCIEAHAVVAERGEHNFELWSHDPSVAIHSFDPRIQLDLNQPVLKLSIGSPRAEIAARPLLSHTVRNDLSAQRSSSGSSTASSESDDPTSTSPLSREVIMDCSAPAGLCTTFLLSRDHPADVTSPGTAVWPPLRLPAPSRTRNSSSSYYASASHRPSTLSEVSQNTFRLRKWIEMHGRRGSNTISNFSPLDRMSAALGLGFRTQSTSPPSGLGGGLLVRMGEEVSTYGTLLPEAYTPTPTKPWRGIWCGDYSGHGCEFLALLQPDAGCESPLPLKMEWMREWLTTGRRGSASSWNSWNSGYEPVDIRDEVEEDEAADMDIDAVPGPVLPTWRRSSQGDGRLEQNKEVYTGRIEAIKLTGDPNIPRGEYTFIAPDLSDQGVVRTAQEEIFRGARIVRSAGHIAARGFRNDEYMPSQIILLSNDRIAQYWEGFGHISFYQRVDLGALMRM